MLVGCTKQAPSESVKIDTSSLEKMYESYTQVEPQIIHVWKNVNNTGEVAMFEIKQGKDIKKVMELLAQKQITYEVIDLNDPADDYHKFDYFIELEDANGQTYRMELFIGEHEVFGLNESNRRLLSEGASVIDVIEEVAQPLEQSFHFDYLDPIAIYDNNAFEYNESLAYHRVINDIVDNDLSKLILDKSLEERYLTSSWGSEWLSTLFKVEGNYHVEEGIYEYDGLVYDYSDEAVQSKSNPFQKAFRKDAIRVGKGNDEGSHYELYMCYGAVDGVSEFVLGHNKINQAENRLDEFNEMKLRNYLYHSSEVELYKVTYMNEEMKVIQKVERIQEASQSDQSLSVTDFVAAQPIMITKNTETAYVFNALMQEMKDYDVLSIVENEEYICVSIASSYETRNFIFEKESGRCMSDEDLNQLVFDGQLETLIEASVMNVMPLCESDGVCAVYPTKSSNAKQVDVIQINPTHLSIRENGWTIDLVVREDGMYSELKSFGLEMSQTN